MKIRTLYIFFLTPLAGCSNSDIDAIKGGRLDIQPQYTVGEAFDNRKVCEETSWEAFEDDRQRSIVEYRCYLNGYSDIFTDKAHAIQKKLKEMDANANTKLDHLSQEIAKEEQALKEIKEALLDPSQIIAESKAGYESRYRSYTEFLSQNNGRDTEDYIVNGIDIPDTLDDLGIPNLLDRAKKLRDSKDDYNYYGAYERAKSSLNALMNEVRFKVDRLPSLIENVNEDIKKYLTEKETLSEKKIADAKDKLHDLEQKYSEFQEHQSVKQEEAKSILATANNAQAYEYYQWTVLDDESFMIVAGGIMEKEPGQEEFSDKPYSRPADTVALVYQDDATDFQQYKQAIGAKAWLRFLGY